MRFSIEEFYRRCDELFRAGDKDRYEDFLEKSIVHVEQERAVSRERPSSLWIAVLNEAASWYRSASKYDRAEKLFLAVLDGMRECGLQASPHYARVLLNLAGLYRYTGELEKAEGLFGQARTILNDSDERDVVAIASTMNNLALVYAEQGRKDDALALARETYRYVDENARDNEHLMGTEILNIGTLLLDCGSIDEAEEAVSRAIRVFEAMPKENVHLAAAYNAHAAICVKKRDFEKAYELFLRALESVERFYGHNIEYAICQENLARCAAALDDGRAREHAACALQTIEPIKPDDDPMVIEYRSLLESLGG